MEASQQLRTSCIGCCSGRRLIVTPRLQIELRKNVQTYHYLMVSEQRGRLHHGCGSWCAFDPRRQATRLRAAPFLYWWLRQLLDGGSLLFWGIRLLEAWGGVWVPLPDLRMPFDGQCDSTAGFSVRPCSAGWA